MTKNAGGKIFWDPTCSWQLHLSCKPIIMPLPSPQLNGGHQYPKSSILVDVIPSGFPCIGAAYVSSRTEERCHIKFVTLIKILKPNAWSQQMAKLRNPFFPSWWIKFNPPAKGAGDEFFTGKSDQENLYLCHFNDLVIKIPYFWSYDTFWSEIVSQNGILIFLFLLHRNGQQYVESYEPGICDFNSFYMK